MAIIDKEKYLKDIASLVRRDAILFEANDRPAILIGGKQAYVGSVFFDMDHGVMAYTLCDAAGRELTSARGMRPLSQLDIKTLSEVDVTVKEYASMRIMRERNLEMIKARVHAVDRKKPGRLGL